MPSVLAWITLAREMRSLLLALRVEDYVRVRIAAEQGIIPGDGRTT